MTFIIADEAFIAYAVEATYGSTPTTTVFTGHQPIVDDGLTFRADMVPRRGITNAGDLTYTQTNPGCEGSIGFDADYDMIGRLLYAAMGTREKDSASVPYDNYFYHKATATAAATGGTYPSLCFKLHRGDTMFYYQGMTVTRMTITHNAGQDMQIACDFAGEQSTDVADSTTAVSLATFQPIKHSHMVTTAATGFYVDGPAARNYDLTGLVKSYTLTIETGVDGNVWKLGNTYRQQPLKRGPLTVELAVTFDWDANFYASVNSGLYYEWLQGTSTGMSVLCTYNNGLASTSERAFRWYLPQVAVTNAPALIKNQGVQEVTVTMRGMDAAITAATVLGENSGSNAAAQSPLMFCLSNADAVSYETGS